MPTNDLNTVLNVNWAHFINFKVNNKWLCWKSCLSSPAIKQWTDSNWKIPKLRLYTEFQHTLRSFNYNLVNLIAEQAYWKTCKAHDSCRHSLRISFWYLEFPRIRLHAAQNFTIPWSIPWSIYIVSDTGHGVRAYRYSEQDARAHGRSGNAYSKLVILHTISHDYCLKT